MSWQSGSGEGQSRKMWLEYCYCCLVAKSCPTRSVTLWCIKLPWCSDSFPEHYQTLPNGHITQWSSLPSVHRIERLSDQIKMLKLQSIKSIQNISKKQFSVLLTLGMGLLRGGRTLRLNPELGRVHTSCLCLLHWLSSKNMVTGTLWWRLPVASTRLLCWGDSGRQGVWESYGLPVTCREAVCFACF